MAGPTSSQRRLSVVIEANVNNFVKGLATAQKALQSASRSMIAVGQNLAFGIGAPIAAVTTQLVKMAAEFEKTGSKIATQTTLTSGAVTQLKLDVEALSDTLSVTASRSTLLEGGLAVASAGFGDAAVTLETLKKAGQLASLGLGDINQVAYALTATMTAFAPQGVNAAEAANAFILAVQEGGFPAEQLAGTIARLGASANMTGVSLQEIIAALAVYTRATGDADEATTGLTRILGDIAAPSEKARKLWGSIFPGEGVDKARRLISEDMIGFLVAMAREMKKLPIEKLQEVAVTLFDNERAARAFMNTFGAQGPAVIETMKRIATNTTALSKALNLLKGTWNHVFSIMLAQLSNLGVEMGERVLPTLKGVVQVLGGWLFAVRPLLAVNAKLVLGIGAVVVGLIGMLVIIGQVGLGIAALGGAVVVFGKVAAATFAFVAAAIGGLFLELEALLGALAFVTGLTAPWLVAGGVIIGVIAGVIAYLWIWNTETTIVARESSSTFAKLWGLAMGIVQTMFRGMLIGMGMILRNWLDGLLVDVKKIEEFFPGPDTGTMMLEGMISSLDENIESGKQKLGQGLHDMQIMVEEAIFGVRPTRLFESLKLEEMGIVVPGEEITKLQQMSVEAQKTRDNVKALEGLKIQVIDVDTKQMRAATLDELFAIQREAGNVKPVDVGIFSFDEMIDRYFLFKARLMAPEDEVPGFISNTLDLLKNLGIAFGDFKIPEDAAGAAKFAAGMAKINDMLFDTAAAVYAAQQNLSDFEVETLKGSAEIAKIGNELKLSEAQILAFQEAWKGLRNTLDATTKANEQLKGVRDLLKDARERLADLKMEGSDTFKEMQKALQVFEAIDLTGMTDAQIKELKRLKLATFDVFAEIEKETKKATINLKDSFLSAIDQVTRGILSGTRDWRDWLNTFSDIGVGIFSDWFQGVLKEKIAFDEELESNFLDDIPETIKEGWNKIAELFGWEDLMADVKDPLAHALEEIRRDVGEVEPPEISGGSDWDVLIEKSKKISEAFEKSMGDVSIDEELQKSIDAVTVAGMTAEIKKGAIASQVALEGFGTQAAAAVHEGFEKIRQDKKKLDTELEKNFGQTLPQTVNPLKNALEEVGRKLTLVAEECRKAMEGMRKQIEMVAEACVRMAKQVEMIPEFPGAEAMVKDVQMVAGGDWLPDMPEMEFPTPRPIGERPEWREPVIRPTGWGDPAQEATSVLERLGEAMTPVTEGFTSFLGLFDGFGTAITSAASSIGGFFTDLFDPDMLKGLKDKISGWFQGVFEGDLFASLKNFATKAFDVIGSLTSMIGMILGGGGGGGKRAKAMRIIGMVGSIAGSLASFAGGISGIVQGVSGAIAAAGTALQGGPQTSVSTQLPGEYATGGIFKRPTVGIIGEAGPEAVLPLAKLGDMIGGSAETTVIVNSPHPATVREERRDNAKTIEVIIDDAVARSFRQGGKAASALERSYGVRRQGGTR